MKPEYPYLFNLVYTLLWWIHMGIMIYSLCCGLQGIRRINSLWFEAAILMDIVCLTIAAIQLDYPTVAWRVLSIFVVGFLLHMNGVDK